MHLQACRSLRPLARDCAMHEMEPKALLSARNHPGFAVRPANEQQKERSCERGINEAA
jgi:hypothetical protein